MLSCYDNWTPKNILRLASISQFTALKFSDINIQKQTIVNTSLIIIKKKHVVYCVLLAGNMIATALQRVAVIVDALCNL